MLGVGGGRGGADGGGMGEGWGGTPTIISKQLSQETVVSPKSVFGHNSTVLSPFGLRLGMHEYTHINYILA